MCTTTASPLPPPSNHSQQRSPPIVTPMQFGVAPVVMPRFESKTGSADSTTVEHKEHVDSTLSTPKSPHTPNRQGGGASPKSVMTQNPDFHDGTSITLTSKPLASPEGLSICTSESAVSSTEEATVIDQSFRAKEETDSVNASSLDRSDSTRFSSTESSESASSQEPTVLTDNKPSTGSSGSAGGKTLEKSPNRLESGDSVANSAANSGSAENSNSVTKLDSAAVSPLVAPKWPSRSGSHEMPEKNSEGASKEVQASPVQRSAVDRDSMDQDRPIDRSPAQNSAEPSQRATTALEDSPLPRSPSQRSSSSMAASESEMQVDSPPLKRAQNGESRDSPEQKTLHRARSGTSMFPSMVTNASSLTNTTIAEHSRIIFRRSSPELIQIPNSEGYFQKVRRGGKSFQCRGFGDCRMCFSRSEHLARHIRKHTGERPFQCRCGRSFSRLDNLRQHVYAVHAGESQNYQTIKQRFTPNSSARVPDNVTVAGVASPAGPISVGTSPASAAVATNPASQHPVASSVAGSSTAASSGVSAAPHGGNMSVYVGQSAAGVNNNQQHSSLNKNTTDCPQTKNGNQTGNDCDHSCDCKPHTRTAHARNPSDPTASHENSTQPDVHPLTDGASSDENKYRPNKGEYITAKILMPSTSGGKQQCMRNIEINAGLNTNTGGFDTLMAGIHVAPRHSLNSRRRSTHMSGSTNVSNLDRDVHLMKSAQNGQATPPQDVRKSRKSAHQVPGSTGVPPQPVPGRAQDCRSSDTSMNSLLTTPIKGADQHVQSPHSQSQVAPNVSALPPSSAPGAPPGSVSPSGFYSAGPMIPGSVMAAHGQLYPGSNGIFPHVYYSNGAAINGIDGQAYQPPQQPQAPPHGQPQPQSQPQQQPQSQAPQIPAAPPSTQTQSFPPQPPHPQHPQHQNQHQHQQHYQHQHSHHHPQIMYSTYQPGFSGYPNICYAYSANGATTTLAGPPVSSHSTPTPQPHSAGTPRQNHPALVTVPQTPGVVPQTLGVAAQNPTAATAATTPVQLLQSVSVGSSSGSGDCPPPTSTDGSKPYGIPPPPSAEVKAHDTESSQTQPQPLVQVKQELAQHTPLPAPPSHSQGTTPASTHQLSPGQIQPVQHVQQPPPPPPPQQPSHQVAPPIPSATQQPPVQQQPFGQHQVVYDTNHPLVFMQRGSSMQLPIGFSVVNSYAPGTVLNGVQGVPYAYPPQVVMNPYPQVVQNPPQ